MQLSKFGSPEAQRGSAIIEFVLVSAPLVLTALTVLSLSLSSFSQLVLRDCAIEGARFAALADQNSSAGCIRAKTLVDAAIGQLTTISANCAKVFGEVEVVEISARLPLLGLLGTSREITVRASAPREN